MRHSDEEQMPSVEVQMLNALELFHYSFRFRHHLFLLAIEDGASIRDLITDLRVLLSARIQIFLFCREGITLQKVLSQWSDRGYPFEYHSISLEDLDNPILHDEVRANIAAEKIPILGLKGNRQRGVTNRELDHAILQTAKNFSVNKLFFVSYHPGLVVGEEQRSHLTPDEISQLMEKQLTINIGMERLQFIREMSQSATFETILLGNEMGNLFQEIFTHRGCGTMFTRNYPNIIRRGVASDVMDVYLMMKPSIRRNIILPITEDELAATIEEYFVYTVNGSIVACARIVDHGEGAELAKFCTLPRYQGKGRAKELALTMIERIRSQGKHPYVFALSISKPMWLFFRNLGFKPCDRRKLPKSWREHYDRTRRSKAFLLEL